AFDPFQSIQGYEEWAGSFVHADTPDEVARIKAKIDRENKARETLSSAGAQGLVAGLAAGLLDPVNLIPVGGSIVKSGRLGYDVAKSAAAGARVGFVTSAAQEAIMQGVQETRTSGESAADIGVTTLLAGALGGAAPLVRAGYGSLRQTAAIARDQRAIGELYRRAHADPEGVKISAPGDRHVIDLGEVQQGLERVVVDRGEGVFRDNGSLRLETNYGLVKVIWKHGVESPEAGDQALARMIVGKGDVLGLANAVRRFEPEHIDNAGKGHMEWRWAIERPDANGEARQVVYAVRRFTHGDQADHVVTIYVPKPGEEIALSVPRKRAGTDSGSPSEGLRPFGDTTGEPSSQLRQGQRAVPDSILAPEGEKVQATPLEDLATKAEQDLAVPPEGLDPLEPGFLKLSDEMGDSAPNPVQGGSVGAKAVHDTTLAEETLKSALGLEKAVSFQDPVLRGVTSPSVDTRRTIQALAETPLYFDKNAAGIASPIAATTRIKMWDAPLARAIQGMDNLFVRYRLGREQRFGDIARLGASDLLSRRDPLLLDYAAFRRAVGGAMRRNDQSSIPEVTEAAQLMRREVFDPLKVRAIKAGLLPEDVKPETAASYLTRVYDIPKIVAHRPEFERRLVAWLREARQQSGERLRDFEAAVQRHEKDLSRLDGEHAGMDGEFQLSEAAWNEAKHGVTAAERDVMAARREVRQTEGAIKNALIPKLAKKRQEKALERLASAEAKLSTLKEIRDAARVESYANAAKRANLEGALRKSQAALEKARKALDNEKGFVSLEDIELADVATQITDQVIGASPARSFYEPVPLTRGPLRERTLSISDRA
ncbi:MAG: hypothetical protein HQK87_11380, partial [Nitrospinae bacterium]|nr:hypothetical protein [Nitrospinota bacterium]